ncbi:DUF4114 domain-containing protein, partial [Cronbergia sp. UHCC 0137]|uniref:DUF4114 domain-containing protein n=1 Tax=Cronbergia sp. UHCC 0137 TaxID=3110239 RepID=UPI002B203BB0
DTFTYSFLSGTNDNNQFTIQNNQLLINNSPDFETKSTYNILVRSTDSNNQSFDQTFTININDLNETPTDLTISSNNVNENVAANTPIATFTTIDPDISDTFIYSLVAGSNDNNQFTITNNQLLINNSPDFEAKSSYSISLRTTDAANQSFEKTFTIQVNDINEVPTNLEFTPIQVNGNEPTNTIIGTFASSDPDRENVFVYSLVPGSGDTDNGVFTINDNQLLIKNAEEFGNKGIYNIRMRTSDSGNLSLEKTLSILSININDTEEAVITSVSDDILNVKGNGATATIKITLTRRNSNLVNELNVYTVDDNQGRINGISPGDVGYVQASLNRSRVIFSSLANLPNGFTNSDVSRLLELKSDENLRFYLVKNSTTDDVLAGITPITDVLFSNPSTQQLTNLGNNLFSLAWRDSSNNRTNDFQDLVVNIQSTTESLPLGTNLQGSSQAELIDLRGFTQQVTANFIVNREAAFNNFVGFYQVENMNGDINVNGGVLRPGDSGYIQAAVRGRANIDLRVNNQGTVSLSGSFEPNAIFAPFIIANGSPDAILDSNPNNDPPVYFAFLGANKDKVDHIRLLGNNIFGFEDLANGGDRDYNDIVVRVNLTTPI